MRNINGLGCPVIISNAHYNNNITCIYSRANKTLSLAKTPSHSEEQKRGESVAWELASSGGVSMVGVDPMVVRGIEGGVVCGVGWTGSSTRRYRGS